MAYTQQTEILAGMLAELQARQAQSAAPAANPAEPPADPNFIQLGKFSPSTGNKLSGPGRWSSPEDGVFIIRSGPYPGREGSTRS